MYARGLKTGKKTYVSLLVRELAMLFNGNHSRANGHQGVKSKSLILLIGPKHQYITASGSKLIMNLKKNIFYIC